MVAQGEYRALCGKKNEQVLDTNVSCSSLLSCLYQTCQDLREKFWYFDIFSSDWESKNQMFVNDTSNADNLS